MITTKNVVLVSTTTRELKFFSNFEAIAVIDNPAEIVTVWEKNKTPLFLKQKGISFHSWVKPINIPKNLKGDKKGFIEFCHSNGFECGEFKSAKRYDTSTEKCFLCDIAKHNGYHSLAMYNQYVAKTVDCIIYESDKFFVTSELGALKQGYVMIVPKEHILSVAQFPESYKEEYEQVCEDVEEILLRAFNGKVVSFMEHGSGPSGISSHKRSVVHAHTHAVVDFTLDKKYQTMVCLRECDDISLAKETHYFSYQEGTKGQLMICMDDDVYVQRQFPRQVMADELGLAPEQYNWRKSEFQENTEASVYKIWKTLNEEQFSSRIHARTKGFVSGYAKRKK